MLNSIHIRWFNADFIHIQWWFLWHLAFHADFIQSCILHSIQFHSIWWFSFRSCILRWWFPFTHFFDDDFIQSCVRCWFHSMLISILHLVFDLISDFIRSCILHSMMICWVCRLVNPLCWLLHVLILYVLMLLLESSLRCVGGSCYMLLCSVWSGQ